MTEFQQKVFATVKRIPKGKVLTYKQVAEKAGSPQAFRAVGSALKTNFDPAIFLANTDGRQCLLKKEYVRIT
ncbi:MAG: Methylated-DNA/protein-cysteine methyltransferase [Parcubacteria group bacterium GW2011_GWA2_49_9]|nr:MAG: Methylated-DNA/protein-cysteine methyltransferase [Parcubacteria group bacterium GW2011_GWA2_49_9]